MREQGHHVRELGSGSDSAELGELQLFSLFELGLKQVAGQGGALNEAGDRLCEIG
jgi:hypothetical protein